ncbi:Phd domain in Ing1-like protein [Mrakia frigida]|uniref:Phd domain in Ing1-like protein n=1 Tax=Mrakia frigida TaxID=29902 RepID=UPI003FCBF0C6
MAVDPNEPRYCYCNGVSYGEMIACDNEDCEKEWFHIGCVGTVSPTKKLWFCRDCSKQQAPSSDGRRRREK